MRLNDYQQRELDAIPPRRLNHADIDRQVVLAMDRRDAGLCDTDDCPNQGDHDRAEEGFYCAACWEEYDEAKP